MEVVRFSEESTRRQNQERHTHRCKKKNSNLAQKSMFKTFISEVMHGSRVKSVASL
jgi:hypothetical protein